MKVGPPKGDSLSKLVVAKLVNVVDFHFNKAKFDVNQSLDKNLGNIYFNLYFYSSVVVDSQFNEDLIEQLGDLKKSNNPRLTVTKGNKKEEELLRKEKATLARTLRFFIVSERTTSTSSTGRTWTSRQWRGFH